MMGKSLVYRRQNPLMRREEDGQWLVVVGTSMKLSSGKPYLMALIAIAHTIITKPFWPPHSHCLSEWRMTVDQARQWWCSVFRLDKRGGYRIPLSSLWSSLFLGQAKCDEVRVLLIVGTTIECEGQGHQTHKTHKTKKSWMENEHPISVQQKLPSFYYWTGKESSWGDWIERKHVD